MTSLAAVVRVRFLVVAPALALVACGGSGGDNLCHAGICARTFSACGGDPTGTWDIVGYCTEGDLKAVLGTNGTAACEDMTSAADVSYGGSLTYAYDQVERDTATRIAFSTSYTPACVAARGAGVLDASVCSQIETDLLASIANARGACRYDGTNCNCDIQGSNTVHETRSFTTYEAWLTEDGGTAYQICVDGNTMVQRQSLLIGFHAQNELKRR